MARRAHKCDAKIEEAASWSSSTKEGRLHRVGDKAVNAEARATLCVMKNLRIGESKIHIERER